MAHSPDQNPHRRPEQRGPHGDREPSSLVGPFIVTALCLVLCLGLLLALAPDSTSLAAVQGKSEGSQPTGADTAQRDEALARARQAADALTRDLMGRLTDELSEGGPGQAIRVCSKIAQEVAERHSADGMEGKIRLRRISRKVRNPADRPTPYEAEQLDHLAVLQRQGDLPEEMVEVVERDGERTLHYMRPITVRKLCLQCHGDPATFDPAVTDTLEELYPEDQAVGYEAGDLRGAIAVAVPLG